MLILNDLLIILNNLAILKRAVHEVKRTMKSNKGRIDWMITLVPFFIIMAIAVLLFVFPITNDAISRSASFSVIHGIY